MSFISERVSRLPPYLFSVLHQKKKQLEARGIDVIDLGIGAPDLPTPPFIINTDGRRNKKARESSLSTLCGHSGISRSCSKVL